ncbi:MAG: hypothetical protein Q7J15_08020 [Candidatus Desulfaltia sp.]|nr:hypothetical protein [Candidatus Desulfaltia sp.]
MVFVPDPARDIQDRIRHLAKDNQATMDEQELSQREEAAGRYAGENESHFVDYCEDCRRTSVSAMINIRKIQKECWDVYNEEPPPNYANKENWQSKVIVPKPFGAVQFAMGVVRKAFAAEFLSIENERNQDVADFWEKLIKHQLNKQHGNFPIQFTDASGMAFAVGQSLEMIPVWRPGLGLRFVLVEPWKIHRDPDTSSRQAQSGMYWIHQEYLDFHVLKEAEKTGRYINVDMVKDFVSSKDSNLTKEEIARKKNMIWQRSQFRTSVLTSEFWGMILDSKGELLLPSATYTVAGNHVISLPKKSPYRTLRWPGISFSPLPQFLRFEGRGLLQGIRSIWYWMCSLMSLHSDSLNWVVNPPKEINISALVDQDDIDDYPGKTYLVRDTISGQQVVRTVDRKNITNEVLANLNYGDQHFQEGSFVTALVQGLPGWRAEVTAREQAQNLEQAMNVFGLMGQNLEDGAIQVVNAAAETIEINAGSDALLEVFPENIVEALINPESLTGIEMPKLSGSFHISGVSAIMKDAEILKAITEMILPLMGSPSFVPYLNPYNIIKSIERRTNLQDEGIVVKEEEAGAIQKKQEVDI